MKSLKLALLYLCVSLSAFAQLGTIANELSPQFRSDLNAALAQGANINSTYTNPAWIISLPWAKLTGIPTFLTPANNLSDLANVATARTNLGLGTAALQNVAFFQNQNTTGQAGTALALASLPTLCPVSGQFATGILSNGNATGCATPTGTGSGLTSVGLTAPSWLTVANSPLTVNGTIGVTPAAAQTSHQVIGTCGASTIFAPCGLVPADIPTLNQNTTGQSGTALALASAPSLCSAGSYTLGINIAGAAQSCTPLPTFPVGSVVGSTDSQTLSSKTFINPTLGASPSALTEVKNIGTGGVTANTLVCNDPSSNNQVVACTTSSMTFEGISLDTAASGATAHIARFGTVQVTADGPWARGSSGIASSGTAGYIHDSGLSRNLVSNLNSMVSFKDACVSSCSGALATVQISAGDRGVQLVSSFNTETFSSTLAFVATSSVSDTFKTTLTGNVTSSTLTGAFLNEIITFQIYQDGTGGRSFVWPTNVIGTCAVSQTAAVYTQISAVFDGTNAVVKSCVSSDPATQIVGPEKTPNTAPNTSGIGVLTFDSGRHTPSYIGNGSTNNHIMPRTAGSTDQLASTDLSDTANVNLLNTNQTVTGDKTMTGKVDASGSTHTLPLKVGLTASKPATCTVGEQYFASDATPGQNTFDCTSTNTWTQQLNSGGGSAFVGVGLTSAIPGTCTTGTLYFATDATAGQNIYDCTATNTWTQQLNSGSGGAAQALSNLTTTSINQALLPQSGKALGSAGANWNDLFLNLSGTYGTGYIHFVGNPTAPRSIQTSDGAQSTVQAMDCTGSGATAGQMITKIDGNGLPTCSTATPRYAWVNGYLNSTIIASTTSYGIPMPGTGGFNTTQSNRTTSSPITGTLKNFRMSSNGLQPATGSGALTCTVQTAPLSATPSYTSTSLQLVFASGSSAVFQSDTTHTASVNQSDLISVQCVNAGTGASAGFNMMALDLFASN